MSESCCGTGGNAAPTMNRAGLPQIAYRAGVHSEFLARMIAQLRTLTTRSTEDFAIALLDAWAMSCDVLTFYQERIANEGYLRTATERRSVLELARSVGYELSPGVAASTWLAFTVDTAAGAPGVASIQKGLRVQSIPPQGKQPQTFETIEAIEARAEWNELRPRLTQPQKLSATMAQVYLNGTDTNLKAGGVILLLVEGSGGAISPAARRILNVVPDQAKNQTRVDLSLEPPAPPPFTPPALPLATISLQAVPFTSANVQTQLFGKRWVERDLRAFLYIQRWLPLDLRNQAAVAHAAAPTAEGVFAFRERLGFFGHNAPNYNSLPLASNLRGNPFPYNWDDTGGWPVWKDPLTNGYYSASRGADVFLERTVPELVSGGWAAFESSPDNFALFQVGQVKESSITGFGLSAKCAGLILAGSDGQDLADNTTAKPATLKTRESTAYVRSEALSLAELPIEDPIAKDSTSVMLGGIVLGLRIGQGVAIRGELYDAPGVWKSEVATLDEIVHDGGFTTLHFTSGLQYSYQRKTVTINANVALATHGETVQEVLGSGDGTQKNQAFPLKKPPLTFVSSPTSPSGTESTLEVRVNGITWEEVPSLYEEDSRSEAYIVRIDNDAKSTVTFGDGSRGARLPSGQENVTATYRSGIGTDGEVDAGSLTLLQQRPLGVGGVTNPVAASGAEDPETLDQARVNAPLKALTLDRVVSLQDFEDFARSFAGIGKALVAALWSGEDRVVHITVAPASGAELADNAPVLVNLRKAMAQFADPVQQFQIAGFESHLFNVKAGIFIDPRYKAADVLAAVQAAILDQFGFQKRNLGQPVTAAEVVTVIQGVEGVVASDLDQLYLVDQAGTAAADTPAVILESPPAHFDGGTIVPARLLLVNPVGIELTEAAL